MASRLRPPGAKPAGGSSKLARPPGSSLRPPSGSGIRKSSPQPTAAAVTKRPVGQATKVRKAAQSAASNESANGERPPQVGDRVVVNGKQGVLAFLGVTQFAKGNWAGIILDGLEGRNNGSVNGVQYFECEPNRGLFAKLEKITLAPRGGEGGGGGGQPVGQGRLPLPPEQSTTKQHEFSVGDRVLMDNQKEGVLGFLGETQFARGVWAGVILDVPEGKNNGAVAGVEYFVCKPNHGLFTRPTKLRLLSKAADATGNGSISKTPTAPQEEPEEQEEEGQNTPQPTPTDLRALHEKLKVGDQVLVGGVKEGILRYLGPTEFAKGIWVGVELPSPMGKNDGAISGKRYFQCDPKHGLFAPLPKVEKLASAGSEGVPSLATSSPASSPYHSPKVNVAHGSRVVEQGAGGVARRRHPSESSTSSFGSSRLTEKLFPGSSLQGSTAADLSFLLQEKDAEIESLQATLDQREAEKLAHQEELTELRRQVDDLQFQLEEQGVISGDQLESATETNIQKVSNLTEELKKERKLTQELRDQLKCNEGDVVGGSGTDQSEKMAEIQSKMEEKAQEVSTHLATIAQLTGELEEMRASTGKAASDTALEEGLAQAKRDLESQTERCSELERELAQAGASLEEERGRCASLDQELRRTREGSQGESERCVSLEREVAGLERTVEELRGELTSSKQGMEDAMDLCSQHEVLIEERNRELGSTEDKLRQLTKEQELWLSEKLRLQAEQERLIGERDKALMQCDLLLTQSTSASVEQNELSQQRRELLSERDALLAQQQAMHTENDKLVSERDELSHLLNELQKQKEDLLGASQQMTLKFSSTEAELVQARSEAEQLKEELKTSQELWDSEKQSLHKQIDMARASVVDVEQQVSAAAGERDSSIQQTQELAERLEKAEGERDELKLDLETAQIQVDELRFQLDELNTRLQTLLQDSGAELLAVQQRLEATESLLSSKEGELATAQEKLTSLSDELIACQGNQEGLLEEEKQLLEEEKLLLEERVKELTLQLEKSQERERRDSKILLAKQSESSSNGNMSVRLEEAQTQLLEAQARHEDLLQEIEDYKQQSEFLNSVIADLQNKLEGVEAMKGLHGHMGSGSDYMMDDEDEDQLLESLPPPRLFCDICDVFDQHDTDDCPMQGMSDSPPHSMHHGTKAPGGSDRPYCTNCEVFGHWTEDCEYEATY